MTKPWRRGFVLLARLALALVLAAGLVACSGGAGTGDAGAGIGLADGEYQVNVTLEGGSGRASVTSPTKLEVREGRAILTVEWSSSNYDYMVVANERYLPVNKGGNSTFEIPVAALDEPISVVADTTAMSTPHEIGYTLTVQQ